MTAVTACTARLLTEAGFLVSEKSETIPQRVLTWMGISQGRIAHLPSAVSAAVLACWEYSRKCWFLHAGTRRQVDRPA